MCVFPRKSYSRADGGRRAELHVTRHTKAQTIISWSAVAALCWLCFLVVLGNSVFLYIVFEIHYDTCLW